MMAVIADSPWNGQAFVPATKVDVAAIESAIVTQLQSAVGNLVEVTHFPDKPEAYEMRHRVGVAMVIYLGGQYGEVIDIGNVVQERTLEFEIGVRIRDLGWAFGGQPSGTGPGAYQLLESIRAALTGFQPCTACTKMRPTRERFVERDKQGGVWVYAIRFATRTIAVETFEEPSFPPFVQGTAQEEGGITSIDVAPMPVAFGGNPETIALGHGNVSSVTVMSADWSKNYTEGVDYFVDSLDGIITRIATGSIPAGATVAVSYGYADVVTALAGGGSAPLAPNN